MSHVYVLVEHDADKVLPVTGELITAARELGTVSAVVVGKQDDKFDADLAALGAAQVVQATAEDYDQRFLTPEVDALHAHPGPEVRTTGNYRGQGGRRRRPWRGQRIQHRSRAAC